MWVDDYATDIRYLNEADVEIGRFTSWAVSENPFEQKMAANLAAGSKLRLPILPLIRVLEAAVATRTLTLTLDIDLRFECGELFASALVVSDRPCMPPIMADNAANFEFALRWLSKRQSYVRLTLTNGNFFWIHCIKVDTGTDQPIGS